MLLGIAIANITTAWVVFSPGAGFGMVTYMAPEGPADQIVGVFNAVFIHMRGLPMFATLFGYGIGMVLAREAGRGTPFEAARKLIQRRYLWLALFGLVHMVFLFLGDIMLPYSLAGIFISLTMLRASDKALLRAAGIMFGIGVLFAVALVVGEVYLRTAHPELLRQVIVMMDGEAAAAEFNPFGSYLGVVAMGLLTAIVVTVGFFFFFLAYGPLIMLGFVAGRRQLLSRVPANRRLLVRISVFGFTLSILGGLIAGLLNMGVVAAALPWLVAPHAIAWVTGAFGGVATIALIALACQPLQERIAGGEQKLPLPVAAPAGARRAFHERISVSVLRLHQPAPVVHARADGEPDGGQCNRSGGRCVAGLGDRRVSAGPGGQSRPRRDTAPTPYLPERPTTTRYPPLNPVAAPGRASAGDRARPAVASTVDPPRHGTASQPGAPDLRHHERSQAQRHGPSGSDVVGQFVGVRRDGQLTHLVAGT